MGYYPIFMELGGKSCLVVGGGTVAERKVKGLLKAKAKVIVLSPKLTEGLAKLKRGRKIRHIPQSFATHMKDKKSNDSIRDFTLVITATSSKETNKKVFEMADAAKIPINTVDNPELCSFIVPAIVDRGSMQIAISTSGKSPTLARTIKEILDDALPTELAVCTEIMGAVRSKLLKKQAKSAKKDRLHTGLYTTILGSPILAWIRASDRAKIDALLKDILGSGYTLKTLGIKIPTRPKATKPKK